MTTEEKKQFEHFVSVALPAIIGARGSRRINQEEIVNDCDLATAYAIEMISQIKLHTEK